MTAGTGKPRPVRWASKEFLETLDAIYKRQGTNLAAAMNAHGLADIERYGTPDEIALAREHMAARGKPGPKPKNPTPASSTADELRMLAELHQTGALTDDEFTAAKARVLG